MCACGEEYLVQVWVASILDNNLCGSFIFAYDGSPIDTSQALLRLQVCSLSNLTIHQFVLQTVISSNHQHGTTFQQHINYVYSKRILHLINSYYQCLIFKCSANNIQIIFISRPEEVSAAPSTKCIGEWIDFYCGDTPPPPRNWNPGSAAVKIPYVRLNPCVTPCVLVTHSPVTHRK